MYVGVFVSCNCAIQSYLSESEVKNEKIKNWPQRWMGKHAIQYLLDE
jgi:hypothetical protein